MGRLLGLPFDLAAFRKWATGDATLAMVVGSVPGFRPTMNPQPFEALVVAITTQQISLQAAASIRGNLVERYGDEARAQRGSFRPGIGFVSCGRATSRRSASRARRRSTSSSSRTAISISTPWPRSMTMR